ncbi:hypothetical protein [Parabacteroides sp.]
MALSFAVFVIFSNEEVFMTSGSTHPPGYFRNGTYIFSGIQLDIQELMGRFRY